MSDQVTHYNGIYYDEGTPNEVQVILNNHLWKSTRLRLHLGDTETGRVWLEEHDIMGTVGRSMGEKPCALLINNSRSIGGGAILTGCILRIQEVSTGHDLYKANNYKTPVLAIGASPHDHLPFGVFRDGEEEPQACFITQNKAVNYIKFMHGLRFAK